MIDFIHWQSGPTWTKLTAWQRLKLKFKPVYIGVDYGDKETTVKWKVVDGKIVILDVEQR